MKKNYFITLILTLCFSVFSFGQGTETFTGATFPTSYSDDSFAGAGGITWTFVQSRDANGDANGSGINLPALMLRRSSSDSKVTSSTISGGIGDFSVKLYKGFTGGGDRQVELFINGVSKGTSTAFDDFNEHVFSVSGINVTGDIVIEIRNITSKQIIIDDITWTAPSSDPSLSITAPSNNTVFPATTTQVPVNLSISNFTLSGDNGSGMTDNSGDGYIKATLQETGEADEVTSFFTDTPSPIEVTPGKSYTAIAELVDNSGASLNPAVSASVSFSVAFPCDIQLGTILTSCVTTGVGGGNTYDISIPFTGGNTSTYTLGTDSGTIGGDDPSTNAAGTITITGIAEGTNVEFTLNGDVSNSTCDLTRNITSPVCVALPLLESFDYTEDTSLIDQPLWNATNTSNLVMVKLNDDGNGNPILGNYYNSNELPDPTGNFIHLEGSGSDPYLGFETVSSGTVYASFMFHVTDMSSFTNGNGGYFALFAENNSFRGRVWVKDVDGNGTQFQVGATTGSSSSYFTGFTANLAEPVFIVIAYDLDNDELKMWVVPPATSFGTNTPPAADVTDTGATSATINRFILRQDSTSETPAMDFDELRIGTSWAEVTANSVASISRDNIEGFATYPNPITNKRFTVSSNSTDKKEVVIFNVLGKKVFTSSFSGLKEEINISNINSGIYILKVTENGKTATKKLVVR